MPQRTLDCLILENQDYIFSGDLIINGVVDITKGRLIVSGKLVIRSNLNIISLNQAEISAYYIEASSMISASLSDIYSRQDLRCESEIISNGNIYVGGDSYVENVDCSKYRVDGNNSSGSITANECINIAGINDSGAISANKIFVGGLCYMNCQSINAGSVLILTEKVECCSSICVGK